MSKPYSPPMGSTAWKVIEFLTTNPDEVLTVQDLEIKFDEAAAKFHSLLGPAVDAGMIRRGTNDEDEIVYRMGKGCPQVTPKKSRNPSLRGESQPASQQGHMSNTAPEAVSINLETVKILSDFPMPPRKGDQQDWKDLFKRVAVSQSFVLPITMRNQANKACTMAKTEGLGIFTIRKINADQIGVWRVS